MKAADTTYPDYRRILIAEKRGHGRFALIDGKDYVLVRRVKSWRLDNGYAVGTLPSTRFGKGGGRKISMHRLIMSPCDDLVIHHKNGNRLDNRRCNLEALTHAKHGASAKPQGSSQFYGVRTCRGKWAVNPIFASFESEEDAARASNAIRQLFRGRDVPINKVPPGNSQWKKLRRRVNAFVCKNPGGLLDGIDYEGCKAVSEKTRRLLSAASSGERCPFAKLTNVQVAEIRSTWDTNNRALRPFCCITARKYSISKEEIRHIILGHTWQHLPLCQRAWPDKIARAMKRQREKAILADYKAGRSVEGIRSTYHVHRTTIYRLVDAAGIKRRGKGRHGKK